MLQAAKQEGLEHIVSWQPHGRAFMVRNPSEFVEKILPRFFSQTKYPSFQRQLNLYGFSRFAHGRDKGAYHHPCFVRGKRSLVRGMIRRKIKGTKVRRTMRPSEEPDFYAPEWNAGSSCCVHHDEQPQVVEETTSPPTDTDKKDIVQRAAAAAAATAKVAKVDTTTTTTITPKVATAEKETSPKLQKKTPLCHHDSPITTVLPFDMILDDDDDDLKMLEGAAALDRPENHHSLWDGGYDNGIDNEENGLPGSDFDFWGFLNENNDNDNCDPLIWDDINFTPKLTMI
jgi:hypothetical protein